MQKYRLISKKGEGTFSEVLKAQSIKTGKYVAIKCMKNHFESIEQVSQTTNIPACLHTQPIAFKLSSQYWITIFLAIPVQTLQGTTDEEPCFFQVMPFAFSLN